MSLRIILLLEGGRPRPPSNAEGGRGRPPSRIQAFSSSMRSVPNSELAISQRLLQKCFMMSARQVSPIVGVAAPRSPRGTVFGEGLYQNVQLSLAFQRMPALFEWKYNASASKTGAPDSHFHFHGLGRVLAAACGLAILCDGGQPIVGQPAIGRRVGALDRRHMNGRIVIKRQPVVGSPGLFPFA